jgi:hypothetical protein
MHAEVADADVADLAFPLQRGQRAKASATECSAIGQCTMYRSM